MQWKKITGYDYEISNTGEVRNITRNKLLKKCIHAKRYYRVSLAKSGVNKSFLIHRLVAEYFCDKPIGYDIVHHRDNDGFNNNSDNLMWTTHSFIILSTYNDARSKFNYKLLRIGKNNPNYKHGKYCRNKYLSKKKKARKRVW